MKNPKSIILIILFIIVAGLAAYKVVAWQKHEQQMSLARELRKAISATMLDLSQAKSASIEGIPPDGQWHHNTSFETHQYGKIGYSLSNDKLIRQDSKESQVIATHVKEFNLRRMPNEHMIVDVKVVLKQGISLNSNFRVRLRE